MDSPLTIAASLAAIAAIPISIIGLFLQMRAMRSSNAEKIPSIRQLVRIEAKTCARWYIQAGTRIISEGDIQAGYKTIIEAKDLYETIGEVTMMQGVETLLHQIGEDETQKWKEKSTKIKASHLQPTLKNMRRVGGIS